MYIHIYIFIYAHICTHMYIHMYTYMPNNPHPPGLMSTPLTVAIACRGETLLLNCYSINRDIAIQLLFNRSRHCYSTAQQPACRDHAVELLFNMSKDYYSIAIQQVETLLFNCDSQCWDIAIQLPNDQRRPTGLMSTPPTAATACRDITIQLRVPEKPTSMLLSRNWYLIAEQPAPAPRLARLEGLAALTHMC